MTGQQLAESITRRIRESGGEAFFVGGCVRDLLLGRIPKDFDVATSLPPERLQSLFPGAGLVGAHFGVVLVSQGGVSVEVATYRSDGNYVDGRRPETVQFETDARQDALRRDFTVNALFLDPFTGKIEDFTGGQADLQARLIRAIGNPRSRFEEDHLRLLRAVRFAAVLDFEIEPATLDAITQMAPLVANVAPERIRDEISRILTGAHPRRGFELLHATGLLRQILPEVEALRGVEQPPQFHPEGDVWTHTMLMLDSLCEPSLTLALGVLFHDIGKPGTFRIADRIRFDGHVELGMKIAAEALHRLRYPGQIVEQAVALVENHMKFAAVTRMRESTLKRFLRMPRFEEHLELHRADCLSSHRQLDHYEFAKQRLQDLPQEALRPAPLITGRDLLAQGWQPGPAMGAVLREIEDAQLEGTLTTAAEALDYAAQKLKSAQGAVRTIRS